MQNAFDKETKYKLFRSVRELIKPTISKKNVSDYKIILDDSILPVRVFYPKQVTDIHNILIYIHGNGNITECNNKYSEICKKIALKTNCLVIAIDYKESKYQIKKIYQDIYTTVKYLYKELERNNINTNNITIVGDSTGCNIITGINYLNNNEITIAKEILFYPVLSLEYKESKYESQIRNNDYNIGLLDNLINYYQYIAKEEDLDNLLIRPLKLKKYNVPETLIYTGNIDSLKDEAKEYYEKIGIKNNKYIELPFCSHGFLKRIDSDLEKEVFEEMNNFLN